MFICTCTFLCGVQLFGEIRWQWVTHLHVFFYQQVSLVCCIPLFSLHNRKRGLKQCNSCLILVIITLAHVLPLSFKRETLSLPISWHLQTWSVKHVKVWTLSLITHIREQIVLTMLKSIWTEGGTSCDSQHWSPAGRLRGSALIHQPRRKLYSHHQLQKLIKTLESDGSCFLSSVPCLVLK